MLLTILFKFINLIIASLGRILSVLLLLLPDSPFSNIEFSSIPFLNTLNWFLPIDFMLTTTSVWLLSIALFYVVMLVLRWAKAIQ